MPDIKIDEKENCAVVSINPKLYSIDTINSAAYSLLHEAYFMIDGNPEKNIIVAVYPKNNQALRQFSLKFYEEVIKHSRHLQNFNTNSETVREIIENALFPKPEKTPDDIEEQEINDMIKELEEGDDEEVKQIIKEIKNEQH